MFQENIIAFSLLAHNGCVSMHPTSKTTKCSSCDSRNGTDCFPHFHNVACMKNTHVHVQMCVIPNISEKCHCILATCAQQMCFSASSMKETKSSSCNSRNSTDHFPHFHNVACMENEHTHTSRCVLFPMFQQNVIVFSLLTCNGCVWTHPAS